MYRKRHFRIHSVWCLLALIVVMHLASQTSTLHLHIHQAHDHHGQLHSHSHDRFSVDGILHEQGGVELDTSQLMLLSKVQLDSFLFIASSILVFICLTKQGSFASPKRQADPLVPPYGIPPPPRAPPQIAV